MISKELVFDHVSTHFPVVGLDDFGSGLARRLWDRDNELNRLTTVLADLHADPEYARQDFDKLDATEGQISAPDTMPLTISAVRRGILYRKLPENAEVDPRIQAIWDNEDGRGIWDEDGKVDALGAGFLLSAFINGLEKGGFPKRQSKAILRQQFEHLLQTECDGRSSYSAVGNMRHMYRVMKYVELHTPETRMVQIRRGAYVLRNFGLALSDF